jgi:uncharacterized protein
MVAVCCVLFAPLLACLAPACRAASFDCTAARSNAEVLVCGDPALSALDETLAQAFAAAAAEVPKAATLRAEQRQWITEQRDKASDAQAMRAAYDDRIQALRAMVDETRRIRAEVPAGTLRQSCIALQDDPDETCRVEESGVIGSALSYQLQAYYEGDLRAVGAIVILAPAGPDTLRPLLWDMEDSAHFAAPRMVAAPGGGLLELPGSLEGTGNFDAGSLYRQVDGRWQEIDTASWLNDMAARLPKGLAVWKGVYPDWDRMTAETPLWRTHDGNCCPSGGSARATLALRGDRIVLTGLHVSNRKLPSQ